jgi:hypothetical protein
LGQWILGNGAVTVVHEQGRAAAAMTACSSASASTQREKRSERERGASGQLHGGLEALTTRLVGPWPAYERHSVPTWWSRPEAGRPFPPSVRFELQHLQQCVATLQQCETKNSSTLSVLYLMIQAESQGETIDKVGA